MTIPVFLNTTHRDGSARVRAPCELRPRGSQAIPGGHEVPLHPSSDAAGAPVEQRCRGPSSDGARAATTWRARAAASPWHLPGPRMSGRPGRARSGCSNARGCIRVVRVFWYPV